MGHRKEERAGTEKTDKRGRERWEIGKHLERFTTRVEDVPGGGFGRDKTRDNIFGKQHE